MLGAPPRTLANLTNHGHPVWPLAMPTSLLGSIGLCEEGVGPADSHLIQVLASQACKTEFRCPKPTEKPNAVTYLYHQC